MKQIIELLLFFNLNLSNYYIPKFPGDCNNWKVQVRLVSSRQGKMLMFNWFFSKKNNKEIDLSYIGIDIHSHLIPGIDDGVETLAQALAMLRKYESLGYRAIYTTPHVIWDCYRNTPEIILSGLETLRAAAKVEGISLSINAAAEYFLDEHFVNMLNSGQKLLTLPGKRVLVELPYSTPLMNTSETLFSIIENGYKPVLAHPERYTYYYSDPAIFKKFCDQGCELQVNALSMGNYYGENIRKMADWLLQNNLITFLGSDAHKLQHLELINRGNKHQWLTTYPFQNEKLMRE